MRSASTVIGAECFMGELLGYVVIAYLVLTNNNAYTFAYEWYHKDWDINSRKDYVPRSKRKKYLAHQRWNDIYEAVKSPTIQVLTAIQGYIAKISNKSDRTWKRRVTRRLPTTANKRIAYSSSSYRKHKRLLYL
jgi:hypothetical protein